MRHNLLSLLLLPVGLAHAVPPIAITVNAIENGLDPKPQRKIVAQRGGRGPSEIVMDTPQNTESPTVIAPIEFDRGKASIRDESIPILRSYGQAFLGQRLKKLMFAIAGHTDSDGSDAANLLLSQQRAQSVQNFLVHEYGIEAWRLRVEAYGESKPLVSNTTPQGKARNRRVEFVRLGSKIGY